MPPRPGVRGCQYCIVSCMSCLHQYQASASAAVQKNPKMAKDAEGDKDAKKEAAVAAVAKAAVQGHL